MIFIFFCRKCIGWTTQKIVMPNNNREELFYTQLEKNEVLKNLRFSCPKSAAAHKKQLLLMIFFL